MVTGCVRTIFPEYFTVLFNILKKKFLMPISSGLLSIYGTEFNGHNSGKGWINW